MIWMQTLSAPGYLDLLDPRPEQIDFTTIATVLARVPRFGGHTLGGVYSVAQHSEQGARAILRDGEGREAAAAFLLHDAHEAYMGDVSSPVQSALVQLADKYAYNGQHVAKCAFRELKARLDFAIYTAAGIAWPLPEPIRKLVKSYDVRMMDTERRARLPAPPFPWSTDTPEVEGVDLYPWSEGTTAALYMAAVRELICVDSPRMTG